MISELFNFLEYICRCSGIAILLHIVLYRFAYFLIQKKKDKEEKLRKERDEQEKRFKRLEKNLNNFRPDCQNTPPSLRNDILCNTSQIVNSLNSAMCVNTLDQQLDNCINSQTQTLASQMCQTSQTIWFLKQQLNNLSMEERQRMQMQTLISSLCSKEPTYFYADNQCYQIRK